MTEQESEIPLFAHDCSLCVFLGSVDRDGRSFDLYWCGRGHLFPTVIARQSDQPHDYFSGIAHAEYDPVLLEALERAKDRGLVPIE